MPDIYHRVAEASLEEIEGWMHHPRNVQAAETLDPQRGGLWPVVAAELLQRLKDEI